MGRPQWRRPLTVPSPRIRWRCCGEVMSVSSKRRKSPSLNRCGGRRRAPLPLLVCGLICAGLAGGCSASFSNDDSGPAWSLAEPSSSGSRAAGAVSGMPRGGLTASELRAAGAASPPPAVAPDRSAATPPIVKPVKTTAVNPRLEQAPAAPAPAPTSPRVPSAAPSPAATPTSRTALVEKGDTLYGLAKRHQVSVKALMTANNLSSSRIVPGQRLILPETP